jgi:putative SOS response-associated peptidase YedK
MCGRYATTRSATDLSALFEAWDDTGGVLRADWNVAPTDPVPLVRRDGRGARVLSAARWGLVPAWAANPRAGARMINARAETVATSRAYAGPFARQRALVPADGWYEWRRREDGRGRQAYFLTPRDGGPVVFAGLWSAWRPRDADPQRGGAPQEPPATLTTCTIVTTAALGDLAGVHDRMPLLLPAGRWQEWLDPAAPADGLLRPPPEDFLAGMEIRPVGPAVGDVRRDGPELARRVEIAEATTDLTLF